MANHLADESSPYLQQHANNPVDWYPWCDEALNLARESETPILLSIGYSTCHWCHVMAHESFEDPTTAAVMNELFINIKVDREERPDLDKIYQTALQLINPQGGGWPLTMFLDPETLLPYFGGTYFPPEPRYQLPGFTDLLRRLREVYDKEREALNEQGDKLQATLDQMTPPVLDPSLEDVELLATARDQLAQQYDSQEGGFGKAPKFPMPNAILRLLNHWAMQRRAGQSDKDALDMVMISLTQMARGGIYDHLGGGFCRYATDAKWQVPHFEKMLYDNGLLLSLYSRALTLGPDALFSDAVIETIGWLQREMRAPEGGFYAALDADSEGEEGKFYVWRREQAKKVLSEDEYLLVETLYGLDKPANFENKWTLHRSDSWRSVVERLSLEDDNARALLTSAKQKLFQLREQRPRPGTDEKILAAWNGLLLCGLADAATQFQNSEWLELAQQTADFLRDQMWHDNILYATHQNGAAKYPGYLDDYANVLKGLVALLRAQWRAEDVTFARALADVLVAQFYDKDSGGFFFTSANSHAQAPLIYRPKPTLDDALPPGNGQAAQALMELGHLLGDSQYLDVANNTLRWARAVMEKIPAAHCGMLEALAQTVYPPEMVILRGPNELTAEWRQAVSGGYTPWRTVYEIPYDNVGITPDYLPKLVSADAQTQVTAFVCSGTQCSLPITELAELKTTLN